MSSKAKCAVSYKAMSDGRVVEIGCANHKEAEEFKKMVLILDPNSDPQIIDK